MALVLVDLQISIKCLMVVVVVVGNKNLLNILDTLDMNR